jgi:hypothetical protein
MDKKFRMRFLNPLSHNPKSKTSTELNPERREAG